jgi:hypothetical protein
MPNLLKRLKEDPEKYRRFKARAIAERQRRRSFGRALPSDIPGLAAWYRYGIGITAAAGLVSQWDDASGNGRHLEQASGTNQPTLDASKVIVCDGSDNYLRATFTLNQPCTYAALMKTVTWTSGRRPIGGSANEAALVFNPSSPSLRINAGASTGDNANLPVGVFGSVVCVFNGASSSLLVNQTAPAVGDAGALNPGGITLGSGSALTTFANVAFMEFVVYTGALSSANQLALAEYLMHVGGL